MDRIKEMIAWSLFIGRAGNTYYMNELPMLKIQANYFQYIMAVVAAPGITQEKLKEDIPLHPSNISRAISYLEKKEFVLRVPHESDRRTFRLYPTEKAVNAAQKADEAARKWYKRITQGVSDDEMSIFYTVIEKLYVNANEYMDGK